MEVMSTEDENDKEEIKIGEYQTKYFHVCPGASSLYGNIESKGVDMDMAERSARLQDALFFVEEHIQRDGYKPEKDYIMVAKNLAKNIMKMAEMMGLEKEHHYIQGHVDIITKTVEGKKLEEKVINLTEKNVPTNPSKWSYYKSQAKKKFDVYPSAYANAWAAKQYKAAGGGWRTTKESNEEGVMSNIHLMIDASKDFEDFKKKFKKTYRKVYKPTPDFMDFLYGMYKDAAPLKAGEKVEEDVSADALKDIPTKDDKKLDEKLITFSNRAAYGQIVFMAGGAGSGKGFAIDNFIDGAGFKVRDVDEMKKQLGKLDALGKFSVDKWYKKFGKNLSTKPPKKNPKGMSPKEHIEEFVLGKGLSISDISKDLKNPNNVASLHYIVDAMKLKDKWLISMLSGKDNKETLPNLLFDITAKKVASITDVLTPLLNAGYDSKNIHLIWVLTNYHIAVDRNKQRDRVVPDDILLQTHEGAGKTMWNLLTKALPKGLNGRVDVILNNQENTIYHIQPTTRKGKKVGVVSDFLSLPIKKQGGSIIPEKVWKSKLYTWIRNNAPKTLDIDQTINKDETTVDYMI